MKKHLIAFGILSTMFMANTFAQKDIDRPIMGWSSWNTYRIHINEALIKKQADAMVSQGLKEAGYTVTGGVNAPYIWLKTPDGLTSWEFFDKLLEEVNVVGTPGAGFGPSGEGYFRLTAFGTYENTVEAVERIKKM